MYESCRIVIFSLPFGHILFLLRWSKTFQWPSVLEVFCQEVKVASDLCKIIVQFWAHYFILAWPGSRFIQRMNTSKSKFLCKISSFSNLVYIVHECKLCAVNFKLPVYIFVMLTISKGPTERMRIISKDLLWS